MSDTSQAGLDQAGRIALGVGLGVGIPLLVLLGILVWFKCREEKVRNELPGEMVAAQTENQGQDQFAEMDSQQWTAVFKPPDTTPSEMDGTPPTGWCRELPEKEK